MTHEPPGCDVSVVVPFTDDEERLGSLARRVAEYLRCLDLRFEILAVDEDSTDNSLALLSLLRAAIPELRVILSQPGEGFAAGSRAARGRALWLLDIERTHVTLAPFSWAHARILTGDADAIVVPGRFLVCRRARAWQVLQNLHGRGETFERRFERGARWRRLRVEHPPRGVSATRPARAIARFLDHLAPARATTWLRKPSA